MDPHGKQTYLSAKFAKEGSYDLKSTVDGVYTMCFRGMDNHKKIINFEFDISSEVLDVDDATYKANIDPVDTSMKDLNRQLDLVNRNIQFTMRREKVHRDLTEQTFDKVLWFSLGKVVALCSISFAQIYVLKSFFDGKPNVSKPV